MPTITELEERAAKFASLARAALAAIHGTPPSRDKVEAAIGLFQDAYRQANPDHKAFAARRVSWALVSPSTRAALKAVLEEPGNEWLLAHKPFARIVERGPRHHTKKKRGAPVPVKEPEKEPEKEAPGEKTDTAPDPTIDPMIDPTAEPTTEPTTVQTAATTPVPVPEFVPANPADNLKKALYAIVDAVIDYVEYVRTADVPKIVIEHVQAKAPTDKPTTVPTDEPADVPTPPPRPLSPPPPRPPKYRVAVMNSYKNQLTDIAAHLSADVREKVDISSSYGKMTDLVLFIRMGTRHHYEWAEATRVVGRDNVKMTDGVLNAARLITGRVNKDPRWRQ